MRCARWAEKRALFQARNLLMSTTCVAAINTTMTTTIGKKSGRYGKGIQQQQHDSREKKSILDKFILITQIFFVCCCSKSFHMLHLISIYRAQYNRISVSVVPSSQVFIFRLFSLFPFPTLVACFPVLVQLNENYIIM